MAQSQEVAAFAGIGKAQPQARETGIDGHEERLGVVLLVVPGSDQHAGEAQDPRGVGLPVVPEEIDQPIAQQDNALFEKLLELLRGEAEIEVVQWRPQQEREALVARVIADRATPPVASLQDARHASAARRRKRPIGEEEPERAWAGVRQDGLDVFAHLLGIRGRLRCLARLGVEFALHVVEGPEHRSFHRRQEFDLSADPLERDSPAHCEGAHGQQVDAAGLLAHVGGGLVEYGEDVDGLFMEAAKPFLQRCHAVMHAQPQPPVRDVLLDLVAVLRGKPACADKAGFMVLCRIDIDQQRRCGSPAPATVFEQGQQHLACVWRVDQGEPQRLRMVDVDLRELPHAALQCLDPVTAAIGVSQVLEDGQPAIVARYGERLASAPALGKACEPEHAEIVLGPFELLQHRLAVHFLESQSTGERGHSLVTPQMQGMGRQQDRFPGRSSGIQPGLDLDDVERGDGL